MARSSFRSVGISLSALGLGCGMSASVCGCYIDDCSDTLTCGSPEPVCVADPSEGAAKDDCGVFVSSGLGGDANPGTKARPVKTLERAIALARTGASMRVYACAETFTESVLVPSGVEIWGGLDCAHEWIYLGGNNPTVIAPEPDRVPLSVDTGAGVSTIADLRLEAAGATIPGGSSIAMVILGGATVDLRRSKLIAGNGAGGAPGERGGEEPAKAGLPGNHGGAACTADSVPGGSAITTVCGDIESVGGKGGSGDAASGGNGNDGQPEPVDNPMGFGIGGTGENSFACLPGQDGMPGADGPHGDGARGPGRITGDGRWEGNPGKDGEDGLPGQGGGGGGGSRGGLLYCGIDVGTPKGGASGGSGGGGGCGGRGGKGGGYGGSSIGLVSLSGDVSITATSIVTGKGGDGGTGGLAQLGGSQGAAGLGGASFNGSHPGCDGGKGGVGGNGGYGGGGLGGFSIGIAHLVGLYASGHDLSITTGEAGKGGLGGNPAVPDSAGEDGIEDDTLGFPY